LERIILDISKALYLTNRDDWRAWLKKNFDKKKEIWLIYYKKHTKIPTIPYDEAVEEAICFGWIDSTVRRIDDEKHMQKYTPRNLKSIWSPYNVIRAKKMIKQGKMTKIGLEKFKYAKNNDKFVSYKKETLVIPKDFMDALKKETPADKNFINFAHSYKLAYVEWINNAKKLPTRQRRIIKAARNIKENRKSYEMQ
jgi:uncharacterized protein YdeI (YjbR/CyaY-like superfamily)